MGIVVSAAPASPAPSAWPERAFPPGEGPAAKVSVSLRAGNIRAIKERVGARGFSAYVDAAVERQIER
ncbi:hypothetical protein ACFHYQ_22520, partial [Sphaerimonospora cavernae]